MVELLHPLMNCLWRLVLRAVLLGGFVAGAALRLIVRQQVTPVLPVASFSLELHACLHER